MFEKTKINKKEAVVGPFKNKLEDSPNLWDKGSKKTELDNKKFQFIRLKCVDMSMPMQN